LKNFIAVNCEPCHFAKPISFDLSHSLSLERTAIRLGSTFSMIKTSTLRTTPASSGRASHCRVL
jgi:hypothetical protein